MGDDVRHLTLSMVVDNDVHEFKVNRAEREISGLILPWGVAATDSAGRGRWKFQRGAVNWAQDPSRVKLLRDHDPKQPVGRAIAFEDRPEGLWGRFKVARGAAGDD